MQLNKVFKGMLIALPVVTMMACTTTDNSDAEAKAAQEAAAQEAREAEERRKAEEAKNAQVGSGVAAPLSAAEQREQQKADLLKTQVVYFDFDRSNVRSDAFSVLDKHAKFLAENPSESVTIEGHCDSRGTPEYNIALGERRAQAVETYLLNAGVSAYQITVVSYGEEKPEVSGTGEAAFQKNRRGVLVYK